MALLFSGLTSACSNSEDGDEPGVLEVSEGGQLPAPADPPPPAPEPPAEPEALIENAEVAIASPRDEVPAELLAVEDPIETPPDNPIDDPLDEMPLPEPVIGMIAVTGGTIETGGFRAVIPGLDESTEVTFTPLRSSDIRRPRPLSVALAVAELQPLYTLSDSMMDVTFPLPSSVDQGTVLQLLSFNRSMDAFSVVDERRVAVEGSVTFRTDVFSQYVIIARPVLSETACIGELFEVDVREPDADERQVVGWVEEENRMSREVAFAVLTDLRHLPGAENIVIKDEERRVPQGQHFDEDFYVDPRLARALVALGQGVLDQWSDPIGGGPAFQLRVTDSYDAQIEHSSQSNHYRGLAVDLTLSPVPAASRSARRRTYGWLARQTVCAGFDFVDFENRFHIHASIEPARLAYIREETREGPHGREIVVSQMDGYELRVVSDEVGFSLEGRDIRSIEFSPDGRTLSLVGRNKGVPEAFVIDLEAMELQRVTPPDAIPRRRNALQIDESLTIGPWNGRLALLRPAHQLDSEGSALADVVPAFLTDEGIRGSVPAVWTEGRNRDLSLPTGEPEP